MDVPPMNEVDVELSYYSDGDFSATGYLDFLLARYHRDLLGDEEGFLFTLDTSSSLQILSVQQATSNTSIWELDAGVVHIPTKDTGLLDAEVMVDANSQYYLATDYKTPVFNRSSRIFYPSNTVLFNLV